MKRLLTQNSALTFLLCALILLPFVVLAYAVASKHAWAQETLKDIAPRHARMLGLLDRSSQLDETELRVRTLLGSQVYAVAQDVSQAGNDAQQRVRTIFSQAGLDVVSSQVLPPKLDRQFDRIPLTFRVEGELLGLQSAFIVLATQTPAVFTDALTIQSVGAVKADAPQRLTALITLSVLKARP
jgi:general secretion pathway protein M